ncbi:MAG: signal peptidase II, partial [Clostridia bacterium]|nr:signal peptidase II [Clostridia bacterium]
LSLKYVVDFIEITFIYFPYVFNVADCCVAIGCGIVILQVIIEMIQEFKAKKAKKAADITHLTEENVDE